MMYPTIFNVVVDAFLQHWVTMVALMEDVVIPGAAGTEGFGWDVHETTAEDRKSVVS